MNFTEVNQCIKSTVVFTLKILSLSQFCWKIELNIDCNLFMGLYVDCKIFILLFFLLKISSVLLFIYLLGNSYELLCFLPISSSTKPLREYYSTGQHPGDSTNYQREGFSINRWQVYFVNYRQKHYIPLHLTIHL